MVGFKKQIKKEGGELTTKCSQLKMPVPDGKARLRDAFDTKGIFRLIESIRNIKRNIFIKKVDKKIYFFVC